MARRELVALVRSKQIRRYLGVGAVAFSAEYTLFALLHYWHWKAGAAQAVSFLFALVISFTMNRTWAFRTRLAPLHGQRIQFMQYASLALFNLILTTTVISLLVANRVPALIAKVMIMAAVSCWNFMLYRTVIFKPAGTRGPAR